jgi:hypothetical protein
MSKTDKMAELLSALITEEKKNVAKYAAKYAAAAKKRAVEHEKRYSYPAPPKPKWYEFRRWLLRAKNLWLRYRGKKFGEVRPYWQRDFNFFELKRQERCSHLKGTSLYSIPSPNTDYSVYKHTFIDGTQRIKCLKCGWEVWNLPEFSLKWAHGMRMVDSSTNRASTSEQVLKPEPKKYVGIQTPSIAQARKTTYDPGIPGQPDNPIKGYTPKLPKEKQ